LPWQVLKASEEDPEALGRVPAILNSSSYRLAEADVDFFARNDLRGVRLLIEYLSRKSQSPSEFWQRATTTTRLPASSDAWSARPARVWVRGSPAEAKADDLVVAMMGFNNQYKRGF
jgi:hypothetical protein